ncbi:MAG TPA: hypothetical protein VJ933_05470 [Phaeodactylibacter sp.]|nr:hypothetical protein [Phaeodactylibacter sp.]
MDNNPNEPWNMKRYESTNRESAIAFVNNLMLRCEDAAQKYNEAAAMASDDSIVEYLESLAKYRQSLYEALYNWMDALPPTPMPVSKRVRSYLTEHWEELREALIHNRESQIADITDAAERSLDKYYREAVAQKGIPKDIHEFLNEQHQHVMQVLRKVERMETVPMLKNNGFNTP